MTLTMYSRPGCHLCDGMMAVIRRVTSGKSCAVETIDISGHPDLEARYGVDIPVLLVDGRKVAQHRISDAELSRILGGQ